MTTTRDAHVPIRTCVGCRVRRPQAELFRCVLDADGTARISRSAPGRGGWVCGPACLDAARTSRGLERTWRTAAPPGSYDRLRGELSREMSQGTN